jgi:hypothetical protein
MFWISCTLFAIAALFNAAIEQIAHHNGGRFRRWCDRKPLLLQWFNAEGDSWRIENEQIRLFRWWHWLPSIPAFLSDAWHFFKMLSVLCLIASVATYRVCFGFQFDMTILYGVRWVVMQFGYNWLFAALRPRIGKTIRFWFKNIFSHQIVIAMSNIKKLEFIESRFVTPDSSGGFIIQLGVKPTVMEIEPGSATWTEQAQSSSGGIYAFQNIVQFKLPSKSPSRKLARSRVAAIITLDDSSQFFVANLRVSANLVDRIGLSRIRTYRYRTDNITRAPKVDPAFVSQSAGFFQIFFRPVSSTYNSATGIIGVSLLGV